jgi:hypothetical protein
MGAARRRLTAASVLALALTAVATAPAGAAVSFTSPVLYPTGAQTTDLVLGDFNLDGSLDVATANGNAGSVSVLLGDGSAAFVPPSTYSAGANLTDIATGDLDGDGVLDLVVADPQQGTVEWLHGLAGGFGAAQTVQPLGPPLRVAVGDVNGDGFADIVSSDFGPDSRDVSIELGDGKGGFGAPLGQTTGGVDFEIALTDLNGDSRRDLVIAEGAMQPRASVLLGHADGSVGPISSFPLGEDAGGLAIADFNGDAKPDIAVGHQSRVVTLLLGDGSGNFPVRRDFDTVGATASSLVAADFDGDGRVDLGVGGGGRFDTMRGTGSGAFEAATTHQPAGVSRVAVGDLDGDGAPDVVGLSGSNVGVGGNISTKGARPLPQPTVAKTANLEPVKGTVLVKQPSANGFVKLTRGNQIPIGSQVDTTNGSVRLTSAAGGGRVQSGIFRGGLFALSQTRGPRPITDLRLARRLRCASGKRRGHARAKRPRTRHLFGSAHGRFRTRGRHSAATIRGTEWFVKDSCRRTLTLSIRGTVVVRDFVKHRTVTLRSGQRYVARRGNR